MSSVQSNLSLRQVLNQSSAYTENGALSLSTTQPLTWNEKVHGRVGFFFKATRSLLTDLPQLYKFLSTAHDEDARDTLVLVFHLRNCRAKNKDGGGKGERALFRQCVEWYKTQGRGDLIQKNLSQVVRFGRWDDVLCCPGGYEFLARQLLTDYKAVEEYLAKPVVFSNQDENSEVKVNLKPAITLAAKWAPSACMKNKKSKGKHLPVLKAINEVLKQDSFQSRYHSAQLLGRDQIREAEYRKMLSSLREYSTVIERLMCSDRWDEIDFNKVPSNAMHLYGKDHIKRGKKKVKSAVKTEAPPGAFLRHREEDFKTWKEALKTGKTEDGKVVKVNAAQLFPHQLVGEYLAHHKAMDALIEAQWKVLEDNLKSKGALNGTIFVADVSGSMTATVSAGSDVRCLDVSVALSLLGARCGTGKFKDMIITFSEQPSFFEVTETTFHQAVRQIAKMNWGMSTNLQAVFDLILGRATQHKLAPEEVPKQIVIVSDMEFNIACPQNNKTNFEVIKDKFAASGYAMPILVFWNVRSSFSANQFPVSADEKGTILLSGYSPSVMTTLLNEGVSDINPWKIVRKLIDSECHNQIVV